MKNLYIESYINLYKEHLTYDRLIIGKYSWRWRMMNNVYVFVKFMGIPVTVMLFILFGNMLYQDKAFSKRLSNTLNYYFNTHIGQGLIIIATCGMFIILIATVLYLFHSRYYLIENTIVFRNYERKYNMELFKWNRLPASKRSFWYNFVSYLWKDEYSEQTYQDISAVSVSPTNRKSNLNLLTTNSLEELQVVVFHDLLQSKGISVTNEWIHTIYTDLHQAENLPAFSPYYQQTAWTLFIALGAGFIGANRLEIGIMISAVLVMILLKSLFEILYERVFYKKNRIAFLQMSRLLLNYKQKYLSGPDA